MQRSIMNQIAAVVCVVILSCFANTHGESPEMSITAVYLTPTKALISYTIDTGDIVELSYSLDDGENWLDIESESDVFQFDIDPEYNYLFRVMKDEKYATTQLKSQKLVELQPENVKVSALGTGFIKVSWKHEGSDEVKGYKVAVEEQDEETGSYSVFKEEVMPVETERSEWESVMSDISDGPQYRVTVRAYGVSALGRASEGVMFPEVEKEDESTSKCANGEEYKLDMVVAKEDTRRLRVLWFMEQGDMSRVARYRVILTSEKGKVLLSRKLAKGQRAALLRPLAKAPYTVTVQALDCVDSVMTEESYGVKPEPIGEPELMFFANEIQNKQARLGWILKDCDHSKLKKIRMVIYKNGPAGRKLMTRTMKPKKQTILLSRLPANKQFFIVMEAIGADGSAFTRASLTLKTPPAGEVGEKVVGAPLVPPS